MADNLKKNNNLTLPLLKWVPSYFELPTKEHVLLHHCNYSCACTLFQ